MQRKAKVSRDTNETKIQLELNLDGKGFCEINSGIEFLDHMLSQVAKHGFLDLTLTALGDTCVDSHHTTEDIGIVLGKAFKEALGNKHGIKRYGTMILPMDEALVLCSVDISGRPYLNFEVSFTQDKLGNFDTENIEEFFKAFALYSGSTLHIKLLNGKNNHHIAECVFKAFSKAISQAIEINPNLDGVPSTKGMLE